MWTKGRLLPFVVFCLGCQFCCASMGCLTCRPCAKAVGEDVPRESDKMSLPPYMIEPPDILLIDTIRVVPLPPYKIEPLDVLVVQATNTLPNEPINGLFGVEPGGTVNLGASYGSVLVAGLTTEEARAAIDKQLQAVIKAPRVLVTLAQSRAMQLVRGEHLVRPDGTVSLGAYGSVYVAGLTLDAAKAEIEAYLGQFLLKPEVSVDIYAYNSKFYYIILDGGGYGQTVYRLPITGNETVLDAISQINGLPAVSSKKKIWVARPTHGPECEEQQILPVDWRAVAKCGSVKTNYQLYPGDRLYVQADSLISFDNLVAKIVAPIERIFGVTLLGQQTILSFDRSLHSGNTGGAGTGLGF